MEIKGITVEEFKIKMIDHIDKLVKDVHDQQDSTNEDNAGPEKQTFYDWFNILEQSL